MYLGMYHYGVLLARMPSDPFFAQELAVWRCRSYLRPLISVPRWSPSDNAAGNRTYPMIRRATVVLFVVSNNTTHGPQLHLARERVHGATPLPTALPCCRLTGDVFRPLYVVGTASQLPVCTLPARSTKVVRRISEHRQRLHRHDKPRPSFSRSR
ncbi:hypothetical protein BDY21DRAFT_352275 [Lineolata rhizophorae]|uniref:Uncharacterized protein n=1 Tax=Lineolata rhizophorae TaxID=578093 RepID=A0A6A6NT56_9PEZI|nr:hypothetical protein BDY21DRAFT_352275 [Lineolata rhizophorae]